MDILLKVLRSKKPVTLFIGIAFLLITAGVRFRTGVSLDIVWYIAGGMLGIFGRDGADAFFRLTPSPFGSLVFFVTFSVVSFFVVSSATGLFGSGFVLLMYLDMLISDTEAMNRGALESFSMMLKDQLSFSVIRLFLIGLLVFFSVQTVIFVR